jgi:PAS domain S-box-containing protein
MIVMYDREGTYLEAWIGSDLEERYGITGKTLVGKSVRDILPAEMVPGVLKTINQIFATGQSVREEYPIGLPKGEFWHDISVSPVTSASGGISALVGFIRDITERKEGESKLEKAEERVRTFIESVDDMIYFQGLDGSLSMLNAANARITGYSLDEFESDPQLWRDIVHPDDLKEAEEFFANQPQGVPYHEAEYRLVTKSGEIRWIQSRMVGVEGADGGYIGYNCVDRDVTAQKEVAEALAESEEKFRRITERSFDIVFIANLEGNLTYVSPAVKEVLGHRPEEMVGHNFSEFVTEESLAQVATGFAEAAQGRQAEGLQFRAIGPKGDTVYVDANCTPVFKDGRVVGNQMVIRDITQRKVAESMLERAHEEQSKHLRQVAGGLAHDVYNDLFPVTASLHKLRKRIDKSESREAERNLRLVELMDTAVSRAIALTESVNLYSRLDQLTIDRGEDLAKAIDDILEQNWNRLSTTQVEVVAEIPEAMLVMCPQPQVYYLFNNLLLNSLDALEATDRRRLSIKAEWKDSQVEIQFWDNGGGIAPEVLPRVFEPFFSTKPRTGTGLGLAIVKRIVDLCRGRVEVESSLDKGTTFTILLPRDVGT